MKALTYSRAVGPFFLESAAGLPAVRRSEVLDKASRVAAPVFRQSPQSQGSAGDHMREKDDGLGGD
jgi:hypothetical protein